MDFKKFTRINNERSDTCFPCSDWTTADWIVALSGEVGELANLCKKWRRGDYEGSTPTITAKKKSDAMKMIGEEIADVFTYLDLLADHMSIDLESEIIKKFNKVSQKVGFKEISSND